MLSLETMRVYGLVNQSALLHNLSIARQSAPGSRLIAVVKKDAYGHGLVRVSIVLDEKVDGFAVASIEEAVSLRQSGTTKPIVMLSGFFSPEHIELIQAYSIEPVVYASEQLEILKSANFSQMTIWVKFDTGMNRLGFLVDEYEPTINAVNELPNINIKGLMTHLASADELDSDFTSHQVAEFNRCTSNWNGPVSIANSAGLLRWPKTRVGWVRPGIMLYGASPFEELSAKELGLQPVINLYSKIISIRNLRPGDRVGYGLTWRSSNKTRIGIVAAGYGDGYHRSASSKSKVLIDDRRANVVGRVSMDSFAVDLSDFPDAGVGTPVKLFGEGLPVEELAAASGTIPYEIFTSMNPRTVKLTYE